MSPSKNFTVRLAIYSVVLLYVAGDLFWFNGPLNRRIQTDRPDSPEAIAYAKSQGVVARVFGHPILRSQVERAAKERLWLEGRSIDDLPPEERRELRMAALNDLIDHHLLRVKVQHNAEDVPVSDEEVDEAIRRLASRFSTREEMKSELEAEGIDSETELRLRLGARIQQVKFLESRIAEHLVIEEEEARAWYEERAEDFQIPDRVRVRHVFLATLNRESDEAKATLSRAFDGLRAGTKEFAAIAAELSDDPRTKGNGGELGWMTLDRLPADFGQPVFEMKVGKPELLRTKIGWHLVEVLEKRPAEKRSFEDAKKDVLLALESAKRVDMVGAYRKALRAQESISIQVFPEMVTGE